MLNAYDVSLYFLSRARDKDCGDIISNLKMQKLLYYAQGNFLATLDKPLFNDKIEAWRHGPVVKNVYDRYKKYGKLAIDFIELDNFQSEKYNDDHVDVLAYVFNKYNSLSAWELREKTHEEAPYINNYNEHINRIISQEDIKNFFKQEIAKEARQYL